MKPYSRTLPDEPEYKTEDVFLPVICIFESDTWQSSGIQKGNEGDSGMS